ncbi:hypothetical protein MNBD_CHLOROFLEXI01-4021 [hydrothermal vent metagenome]|uniref:Uncharacterized protein n=1 Tax=hydrothermal vent metagenome TaxID=652676 RepID=A0A3B0V2Z0_9ZZZZ
MTTITLEIPDHLVPAIHEIGICSTIRNLQEATPLA